MLHSLKDFDLDNKTVICRVDINVPIKNGKVIDATRIEKVIPTIKYLIKHNAKIVLISHFGRPKGKFNMDLSLAPLVDELSKYINQEVQFAVDCISDATKDKIANLKKKEVLLLENVRFYEGEENNSEEFALRLSQNCDLFVNDAFSCSHRSHSSIVGLTKILPSAAGLLLESEINELERVFSNDSSMMAVIGGSKVSTKLDLLNSLITKAKLIVVGGAMANTFLKSQKIDIGKSLYEKDMVKVAEKILNKAQENNCEILLPIDYVCSTELKEDTEVVVTDKVKKDLMILDLGPRTVSKVNSYIEKFNRLIWNGPLGAFEFSQYNIATTSIAQEVSRQTRDGTLTSVAGGGDILAALKKSGLCSSFTYLSTAGGAFLEWLEGKDLPGIKVLKK